MTLSLEEAMICTCDVDGIRAVEACRIDAMRRLGLARPADLTLAIVLSLALDFATDATVDADQWFRVTVTTPLTPRTLSIECDHPADGLLYLWTALAAEFPERVTRSDAGAAADVLAATEASAVRVKVAEETEATGREYDEACEAFWGTSVLGATIAQVFSHLRRDAEAGR